MSKFGRRTNATPVAFGVVALMAMFLLFPSALRPPPDEANASAEFSPDAPPDEDPDVIIQTLEQARSQTAGGLRTPGDDGAVAATTTTLAPPPRVVQTKGRCWGDPPRQTESTYAAPCKELFVGDNGGATYAGVTGDEVRIGFLACTYNMTEARRGPEPAEKPEGNGGYLAENWAYRKYFNDHYETYNRYVQFYGGQPTCDDAQTKQASAISADDEFNFFAVITDDETIARTMLERKKMVFFTWEADRALFDEFRPYLWAFAMTGQDRAEHSAEYVCKRLAGRPAVFAGDPLLEDQQRKFGLLLQGRGANGFGGWEVLEQTILDRCGEEVVAATFTGTADASGIGQALAQFRLDGVTTVVLKADVVAPSTVTKAASGQNYYPEWNFLPAFNFDHPVQPKLFGYDPAQWENAFGLGETEPNRPTFSHQWGRAYLYAYPDATYAGPGGGPTYRDLEQLFNGIQEAGPILNPETFSAGLLAMPHKFWTNGDHGGGYGEGDWTYSDDLLELWWDPEARNYHETGLPQDDAPGAYVHVICGKRYRKGTYPDTVPQVFDRGVACPTGQP